MKNKSKALSHLHTYIQRSIYVLLGILSLSLTVTAEAQTNNPNAHFNSVWVTKNNTSVFVHVDLSIHNMQYVDTEVIVWFRYTYNDEWVLNRSGGYVSTSLELLPSYNSSRFRNLDFSVEIRDIPTDINLSAITPYIEVRRQADNTNIGQIDATSDVVYLSYWRGVYLYEGNSATQDLFCFLQIHLYTEYDFTENSCSNDEARSLVLVNIAAGSTLEIYDSSSCNPRVDDDVTIIFVKRDVVSYTVHSFEASVENQFVDIDYHPPSSGVGLDGKVSCIRLIS